MRKKRARAALGPAQKKVLTYFDFSKHTRIACAPTPCLVDGCIFKLFLAFDRTRCMVHMLSMGPLAAGHLFVSDYIADHTHVKERPDDLNSMMAIALASSPDEVRASALSRRTLTYDVNRHMYLRHTFVTVYCLDDGQVVDKHKHWMQAGGNPISCE